MLLVGRQEGHPACKTEQLVAGMVVCLEQCADLHMAQRMPLPLTVSCFSRIQIGFTFLVPADTGSPWKKAVKRSLLLLLLFCYLFLLGFVTSTLWLPTEWHQPSVWTPCGTRWSSWFQAVAYHISTYFAVYLVFMRYAYLKKCCVKLTRLSSNASVYILGFESNEAKTMPLRTTTTTSKVTHYIYFPKEWTGHWPGLISICRGRQTTAKWR